MNRQIFRAQAALIRIGLDAFYVSDSNNVKYLLGFYCNNISLLLTIDEVCVIATNCEERLLTKLSQLPSVRVSIRKLSDEVVRTGIRRIGYDKNTICIEEALYISAVTTAFFIPISEQFALLRQQKAEEEIENIKKAQVIVQKAFEESLTSIKAGKSELDISRILADEIMAGGADSLPFMPLVQSGPNSLIPHARPTERKLQERDSVIIDMGCCVNGYCSDFARTVVISSMPNRFAEIYNAIVRIQSETAAFIHAGATCHEVDSYARKLYFDRNFHNIKHSIGHGVGVSIHERPFFPHTENAPVLNRSVISLEPGIYIEGEFGIRLEDLYIVKDTGCKELSYYSKDIFLL